MMAKLSLDAERQIDGICVRFEAALQSGQCIRIEEYLGATAEPELSILLRELVRLEIEYRRRRGETPTVEEYRRRFPVLAESIAHWYPSELTVSREQAEDPPSGGTIPDRFLPGQVLAGRYRIVNKLGKGGMGEVYRADDLCLGQSVALKFLPAEWNGNSERLARLREEVKLARQISHPNVCRVYDIAEANGQPFLSMEFIDGEDLASLLRRISRLPSDKGIEIARQLCLGLAAAHEKSVVHRDLKPANVMLDGRGKVRITDFGLARLASPLGEESAAVSLSGTLGYMAPEQFSGKPATVQSDLYALGLILYEVFTGKRAFEASAFARKRDSADVALPSSHVSDLDPAVERVILRCLQNEPGNRPTSALAIVFALPGGDPLAAAQATGDTPSPGLVAASGGEGGLDFRGASLLLGAGVVAYALFTITTIFGSAYNWNVGIKKSPDVFVDRANELLKDLNREPPSDGDRAFGCTLDKAYFHYANHYRPKNLNVSSAGVFWYRTSPSLLVPADHWCRVTPPDPPPYEPGMANLVFDADGKLTSMVLMLSPAATDKTRPVPLNMASVDRLLLAAGVDKNKWQPAEPNYLPEIFVDSRTRLAWTNTDESGTTTVEIGGINGQPSWLKVVRPWEADPVEVAPRVIILEVFQTLLVVAAVVGSVIAAWRNFRSGRSDQRAALRIGLFVFVSLALSMALRVNSFGTVDLETSIAARILAFSSFAAILMWIWYLAVEPMVRRAYPQCLISSTRLIYGRFTDPHVGREILWGVLLAIVSAFLIRLICVLGGQCDLSAPWPWDFTNKVPNSSLSLRHSVGIIIGCLIRTLVLAYMFLIFLTAAVAIFHRPKIVGVVLWLTLFTSSYNSAEHGHPSLICLCNTVWATLVVITLLRFGLLSCVIAGFGTVILLIYGTSIAGWGDSNPSPTAWLAPLLLGSPAIFGFVTATKMVSVQALGVR